MLAGRAMSVALDTTARGRTVVSCRVTNSDRSALTGGRAHCGDLSLAKIVLGLATSHSPMLSTPWEKWGERVKADRANPALIFRGEAHDFERLARLRASEAFATEISEEKWRDRHARCQAAIDRLAARIEAAAPDVLVIVGNDQKELFTEENMASFTVYWGEEIANRPRTPAQIETLPPGIAIAERGHAPPHEIIHPGCPDLGRHIIASLIDQGFDPGQSDTIGPGTGYVNGAPHAFGFVYRRLLNDALVPNVPIILNTFYPPNRIPAARCIALGRALKRAIESWPDDRTVAVIGSGGLSHFVIDEETDRKAIDAMQAGETERIAAIPEAYFASGTSELKNWITHAAIMDEAGKKMAGLDYIPCYRSLAGTGNAMGFAVWE